MAVRTVVMPKYGLQQDEGTVVRWLKQEGDRVAADEVLLELETDKAVFEHKAGTSGVVRKLVAAEGETVPVLSVIAVVTDTEEEDYELEGREGEARVARGAGQPKEGLGRSSHVSRLPSDSSGGGDRVRSSPSARKRARELGVDLTTVTGTGPRGRILPEDVEKAAAQAGEEGNRAELSRMRKAIGRTMTMSKTTIPHFYTTVDIDMTDTESWRASLPEPRPSITDLVVKAAALTLMEFPDLNASLDGDSVVTHDAAHIGLAVATDDGLLVPVIADAQALSLEALSALRRELVEEARAGRMREGPRGTFTLSNLGMFGVRSFSAIITPPEAAALAVGAVLPQVRPVGDPPEIAVRQVMEATLSADHRLTDGAEAAGFLMKMKERLEGGMREVGR